ncbi:MAG: aminotransferase class I/II-fold pyridoxal phosphate-dependent enzyme [Victivallaceae bacterium]
MSPLPGNPKGVDFRSNDILGLANSQELYDKITDRYGVLSGMYGPTQGASGSRINSKNAEFLNILEDKIAHIHGYPTSLICHCGYMANQSLCFLSVSEKDVLLFDEDVHISLKSGVLFGKGKHGFFSHNDLGHLEEQLIKFRPDGRNIFIGVSSVYSQDGSLAPLEELIALSQKYDAKLIVDEAHAIGVFGNGLGFTQNLCDKIFGVVVTFGKALGTFGAAVLGGAELKEYLIHFSYPSRFSTAFPLYNLVAVDCAYDLMLQADRQRDYLLVLRRHFLDLFAFSSPGILQSLNMGTIDTAIAFVNFCFERGFLVNPVASPQVFSKQGRVRVTLHAFNTKDEIDKLHKLYDEFLKKILRQM